MGLSLRLYWKYWQRELFFHWVDKVGEKCEFEATSSHLSTSVSLSWQLGSLELMKLGPFLRDHDWCFRYNSCQAQLHVRITWET